MTRIDFNCDLGEGCGFDAAIIPLISSASIACGGHAGDAATMHDAVALCLRHDVAIGAHPSFEDREHFGRRELPITPDQTLALLDRQIKTLATVCQAHNIRLQHVKPHGALYNLAAHDIDIAKAIATSVHRHDPALTLYALSGSALAQAGEAVGLRVAHEVFAERRYESDGTLTPRDHADAVISDIAGALAQVESMLADGRVIARTGEPVPIRADTLCLHGDRPDAPAFARALHDTLSTAGVRIVAPGID